jgi:hypothetical protein
MRNPPTQNGVALTNKLDSPWSAKMIGRKRRTALVALIVSAVFSGAAAATVTGIPPAESSLFLPLIGAIGFTLAAAAWSLIPSEVARYRQRHQRLAGPRPGARLGP